jgi:hypothetical protein
MTRAADEFAALTQRGHEVFAAAMSAWEQAARSITHATPGVPPVRPADLTAAVDAAFDFASRMLAEQRDFAASLLAASSRALASTGQDARPAPEPHDEKPQDEASADGVVDEGTRAAATSDSAPAVATSQEPSGEPLGHTAAESVARPAGTAAKRSAPAKRTPAAKRAPAADKPAAGNATTAAQKSSATRQPTAAKKSSATKKATATKKITATKATAPRKAPPKKAAAGNS